VQNKLKIYLILILNKLIKWLFNIVKKVDKNQPELTNNTKVEKFIKIQSDISIKRAEIIEMQRDLMQMVEPIILNLKNIPGESENKTYVIRTWLQGLSNINDSIDDHEKLVIEFEEQYNKLNTNIKNNI
jgi:methyl-accepting chemotaxis protein